jgi:2-polyprenyl-6-methoxyphenol hydroxylase-like FAD-dependent oxidoreductase
VNKSADIFEPATVASTDKTRERLLNLFRGWCEPVAELIQSTPLTSLVHNPVFDRPPVRKWGAGSVVLIGDAIHPLTPNLGQGGCLAIEDAAVLARCLEKYASGEPAGPRAARRRFENLRYSRTASVERLSRLYGVVGQWENLAAVELRGRLLSMVPTGLIQRLLLWTFDYDAYGVTI